MEKPYMDRSEAAAFVTGVLGLKISKNTLKKMVTTGGGPQFLKFGNRAIYTKQGLTEWAERKLSTPRLSSRFLQD